MNPNKSKTNRTAADLVLLLYHLEVDPSLRVLCCLQDYVAATNPCCTSQAEQTTTQPCSITGPVHSIQYNLVLPQWLWHPDVYFHSGWHPGSCRHALLYMCCHCTATQVRSCPRLATDCTARSGPFPIKGILLRSIRKLGGSTVRAWSLAKEHLQGILTAPDSRMHIFMRFSGSPVGNLKPSLLIRANLLQHA